MSDEKVNIINKVRRKLRESTITTIVGDDYSELLTDFLTETKREVEDSFDWNALDGSILLDTIVDAYRYKLLSAYERSKIYEVYDQTNDVYLEHNPNKVREGLKYASATTGDPKYWEFVGYNNGEMLIDIYPVPDSVVRIFVNGKFVQGDLGYTTPEELILTPTLPLVLGTYAKAVDERGEDDGEAVTKAENKYARALADAIAFENGLQGDVTDWEVE